ncbi:MAG: hypothetical protein ACRCTE_02840 [Cellulosilyticaceae bacterium]
MKKLVLVIGIMILGVGTVWAKPSQVQAATVAVNQQAAQKAYKEHLGILKQRTNPKLLSWIEGDLDSDGQEELLAFTVDSKKQELEVKVYKYTIKGVKLIATDKLDAIGSMATGDNTYSLVYDKAKKKVAIERNQYNPSGGVESNIYTYYTLKNNKLQQTLREEKYIGFSKYDGSEVEYSDYYVNGKMVDEKEFKKYRVVYTEKTKLLEIGLLNEMGKDFSQIGSMSAGELIAAGRVDTLAYAIGDTMDNVFAEKGKGTSYTMHGSQVYQYPQFSVYQSLYDQSLYGFDFKKGFKLYGMTIGDHVTIVEKTLGKQYTKYLCHGEGDELSPAEAVYCYDYKYGKYSFTIYFNDKGESVYAMLME